MNRVLLLCLAIASAPAISWAGFSLPPGVHTVDTLDGARAEAAKERKGLAFVLSDRKTKCPKCVAASEKAFKKLKAHSVIVYLDSNDSKSRQRISPMVVTALQNKLSGNLIPKATVTSPDMRFLWASMSYNDLVSNGKYLATGKSVEAFRMGRQEPADPKGMMLHWPIKGSDQHFVGRFEGLNGDKLILKMEKGGTTVGIATNRLTDESVAFARALAGEGAGEGNAKEKLEAWTGSNGIVLQARFVNLAGDSVTLQTADGKSHTMPLTRLDAASQEKAKGRQVQP